MSLPVDAARLAVGTLTVLPVAPPRDGRPAGGRRSRWRSRRWRCCRSRPPSGWSCGPGTASHAPPLLTGLLAVGVLALGSGGLHLDGLADTADGLAVPGDPTRRLAVMRTGDVGPVGAATLLLVLSVQAVAVAGVLDRYGAVGRRRHRRPRGGRQPGLPGAGLRPRRPGGAGRRAGERGRRLGAGSRWSSSCSVRSRWSALLLDGGRGVAGVVVAVVVAGVVLLRAVRRLGGVTGDVLGAVVEVALAGYLVAQVVGPRLTRASGSAGAGADHEDPVVLGRRVAAAVAVGRRDPQHPVGGHLDGAQPAVLADEERRRVAGLAVGDLDPPEPGALQRPEPQVALGVGEPGRRGLVGAPDDARVDEAPRSSPRPSTSGQP